MHFINMLSEASPNKVVVNTEASRTKPYLTFIPRG